MGKNKTWRGLLAGTVVGGLTGWLVYPLMTSNYGQGLEHALIGATIGFAALLGDAVESFFKRQHGIKAGNSWYGFDQLDYVVGAILFSLLFIRLDITSYIAVILFYFVGHLVMTYVGYLLKLKDKPI